MLHCPELECTGTSDASVFGEDMKQVVCQVDTWDEDCGGAGMRAILANY